MTPAALALTPADLIVTAKQLRIELAALEAVLDVESRGNGFLPDGRLTILFEGHIFWRQLGLRGRNPERLKAGREDILYPRWTREHYRGGAAEWERLERAEAIDREAAWCSASWGLFQIMGFNHGPAGFGTVTRFVEAMKEHERRHLEAFATLISSWGLTVALREKDWTEFARKYNGSGAVEEYAGKLAVAYERRSA